MSQQGEVTRDDVLWLLGSLGGLFRIPFDAALIAQAVWSAILVFSGTFDQLFTYVIFAGWIFYALGAAAVFILRRKRPDANRKFRVPGYPYVPLAFVVVATWFMVNTVVTNPADSMVGLLLVVVGIPFYLYWRRQVRPAPGNAAR